MTIAHIFFGETLALRVEAKTLAAYMVGSAAFRSTARRRQALRLVRHLVCAEKKRRAVRHAGLPASPPPGDKGAA